MFNKNILSLIGLGATLLASVAGVLGSIVNQKQVELKIEEEVNKAIAKQNEEEES